MEKVHEFYVIILKKQIMETIFKAKIGVMLKLTTF